MDLLPPDNAYEYDYDQFNISQEVKEEILEAIDFQETHHIAGLSTDVDPHSITNSAQSGNQFGLRSRSRYTLPR